MKYKQKLLLLLILSILIGGVSFVFLVPVGLGLCTNTDDLCIYKYADYERLTSPILLFSIATIILISILSFFNEAIFKFWSKFAITWVIVSAYFINKASDYSSGWGISFPSEKELLIVLTPGLFFLISLILIARQSWKLKKSAS